MCSNKIKTDAFFQIKIVLYDFFFSQNFFNLSACENVTVKS